MSGLAKEFQADVVHTDTFFLQYSEENLEVCQRQALPVVSEPTFETNDFALRIRQWVNRGYNWESVTNFCRRDFLTANQILFPELRNYEDMIFSFAALCFAEKFLRVPNLTYVYRQRLDSITHENYVDVSAPIHKYLVILKDGFHAFERIMRAFSFFEKRIDYRYAVLNFYFNDVWHSTYPLYMENPPFVLNDFVRNEFHFDDSALSSYLFDMVNIYRLQILQLQQENVKLRKFQK